MAVAQIGRFGILVKDRNILDLADLPSGPLEDADLAPQLSFNKRGQISAWIESLRCDEVGIDRELVDFAVKVRIRVGPVQLHKFIGYIQFRCRQIGTADSVNSQRSSAWPPPTNQDQHER